METLSQNKFIGKILILLGLIFGLYLIFRNRNESKLDDASKETEPIPLDSLIDDKIAGWVEFKPHLKGSWRNTNDTFTDPYSGNKYNKDEAIELISLSEKFNLYRVRYKDNPLYVPVGEISKGGNW